MDYETFLDGVQNRGNLESRDEAEQITLAVLRTLGERLNRTEREHLATQLTKKLQQAVMSIKDKQSDVFNLEEFYNRVTARAGVGFPKAVASSQVVISVLQDAIAAGEQRNVIFELPSEYEELFGLKPERPEFVKYT